jgi:lysophospholipase L1-like esterase
VAVYGDSFVESRFTPEEATFVARLARELAGRGPAPEAVNAGVTGYGPDQAALRIERELGELRPALLVVALFAGNDWGDLVRNQIFGLDGQGSLVRRSPALDPGQLRLVAPPRGADAFAIVRALRGLRRSFQPSPPAPPPGEPRSLAWALRECEGEYAARASGRVGNLFGDHYDADVALRPDSESARYKRGLMRGVMARLRATAGRAGVPLLLLAIPDYRDLCAGCPHAVEARAYPAWRPSALTDALEEIARAEGVPLVNLFAAFAERPDALYHSRDGHWNEDGQALAARLTAARVAEEGWLR